MSFNFSLTITIVVAFAIGYAVGARFPTFAQQAGIA